MSYDTLSNKFYADCYSQNRSSIDEQATAILDLISSYIDCVENISVLDVGSGPGRLAIPIAQKVDKMVCIESDLLAVNYLRRRAEENNLSIEIHAKKIQDLSKDDLGCFDLVILSHIIHWIDAISLFHLSNQFLKDTGYILLSYFDLTNLNKMLFYKISGEQILKIQQEITLSTAQVKTRLSQANLSVIHKADIPISVDYGNGKLEDIIKSSGTLAWKKLQKKLTEDEYSTIKQRALNRLADEPCLIDTEYRTVLLAKKVDLFQ